MVEVASTNAGASAAPEPEAPLDDRSARPSQGEATLVWETSEADARDRARRQRRPMIVYLRADWSAAALELDRGVWSDPRVRRAARGFVALKLDLTMAEGDAELYAQHYGVRTVPTTVVIDASGKRIAALSGAFEVEDLMPVLTKAIE